MKRGGGLVTKLCPTLATPWTVVCQISLSMGFSRQQCWSGLPTFFLQSVFPIESESPALQADSLPTELRGKLDETSHSLYVLLSLVFMQFLFIFF